MKKALVILSSMLVAVGAFAQGQVNFAARVVGTYDAPVFVGADTTSGVKADGPAYMAQLYAGATQAGLAPVGAPLPFRTGAAAGYWTATAVTINTVDATGNAFVQVRAWATSAGATYEAALAANAGGFGTSAILTVKPTSAPDVPATLTGLASFAISATGNNGPEPSVMAVAALGGLALLLRRRK
jgi:uncharacterized protein (TIGR03382 family)